MAPEKSTPARSPARPWSVLVAGAACIAMLASCGGGSGSAGSVVGSGPQVPPGLPVDGPAWRAFAGDAQHTAIAAIATQDLNRISWSTPLDLAPPYTTNGELFIHYGSPVVTSHNAVLLPLKTGASGGFRVEARAGSNGGLIWSADSDYRLPPHNWVPSYNLGLTVANRLYAPGAGGKLLVKDDADAAGGTLQSAVFYGASVYAGAAATFDANVFINTPLTVDPAGNVFFGFIVLGANPAELVSGIARVGADGVGSWVSAAVAAGDAGIDKVAMNSAPALSPDLKTLYVAVNSAAGAGFAQRGYLLALDSGTLAVKGKAALVDPGAGTLARVTDDSTSSPTVGADGEVFFGVLETAFDSHNGRGWLLHFDATLATPLVPGGFGWDDTASIMPASMVPSYAGGSNYLLMTKYNNYAGIGSGDGANRVAVIDPRASQVDPISGLPICSARLSNQAHRGRSRSGVSTRRPSIR